MRIIVGIDPGLDGGVAVLNELNTLDTAYLPTIATELGREIDCAQLTRWISDRDATEAIIERAQPMPDQGIVGAFHYGMSFGAVVGVLRSLLLPVTFVHPLKWKNHYGLANKKGRPKVSQDMPRLTAIAMWGDDDGNHQFPLKKDIHRAEAALIADYAMHQAGG